MSWFVLLAAKPWNGNSGLITGAKRENYQAGRIKLAFVCEVRTYQAAGTVTATHPLHSGFVLHKTQVCSCTPEHSGPIFGHWVFLSPQNLLEPPLHPSLTRFLPAHAAVLQQRHFAQHTSSSTTPAHALDAAHLPSMTNFFEKKGQKMSTPFPPPHPTLPHSTSVSLIPLAHFLLSRVNSSAALCPFCFHLQGLPRGCLADSTLFFSSGSFLVLFKPNTNSPAIILAGVSADQTWGFVLHPQLP